MGALAPLKRAYSLPSTAQPWGSGEGQARGQGFMLRVSAPVWVGGPQGSLRELFKQCSPLPKWKLASRIRAGGWV